MATGVDARISKALLDRLEAFTSSPAIIVSWPDVATAGSTVFEKPKDSNGNPLTYLEARLFWGPTEAISVDELSENDLTGFLQITILRPKMLGEIGARELAALLIQHFRRGTVMTDGSVSVRVNRAPYAMTVIDDPPYTRTPVTVRWQAFAAH
jgi:hypothetical protein